MKTPDLEIDFRATGLLKAEEAHFFRIIPVAMDAESITLAGDSHSTEHRVQIQLLLGKSVKFNEISAEALNDMLSSVYPRSGIAGGNPGLSDADESSDVIRFINRTVDEAIRQKASDIHFERYESEARIRFRWEGQLVEKYEVSLPRYNALISRIKIMADLDISERRLPQDGRINIESATGPVDVRVSTLPGKYGEKAVLRLLIRSPEHLQIAHLNFGSEEEKRFRQAITKPNGIILITGPTGSGKTTTLYATLNHLNRPNKNILTAEDPVEYNLAGINQVQVREDIGLSFGRTLRAFLRQDPDIIMVGEIRDAETAQIAIRAALTGHLVFSTLHTNSAGDAITRLLDMGIAPYLLAASLRLVVAQRLVRILCPNCKFSSEEILFPELQQVSGIHLHYMPKGCSNCFFTGYTGRKAVFEVLPIDKNLGDKIKAGEADIPAYMQVNQIYSLTQNLKKMVSEGMTSLEEAYMHWNHEN
ncbi:MAG: GspE/PulE family protein [Bacteroidia bacterium]|nr:GspE/PulE family protein [Bacteroidia bacterium]